MEEKPTDAPLFVPVALLCSHEDKIGEEVSLAWYRNVTHITQPYMVKLEGPQSRFDGKYFWYLTIMSKTFLDSLPQGFTDFGNVPVMWHASKTMLTREELGLYSQHLSEPGAKDVLNGYMELSSDPAWSEDQTQSFAFPEGTRDYLVYLESVYTAHISGIVGISSKGGN